jgi:hypothetical protein
MLTAYLVEADEVYRSYGDELIITGGSEPEARHSYTSLHYALPARAADVRTWDKKTHQRANVPIPSSQHADLNQLKDKFCEEQGIPADWIEVILEDDHIHIEYQPKRQ